MPIIRKQLKPSDVYPDDIRYDQDSDTVQSLINGTWTNNPHVDPRLQTTLPPRLTSNPSCDAAESIMQAFKGQVEGVLTAISGSQTAFTIAGIILSLLAFGPFGVFISLALLLAHVMLDAGTASIEAALTDPVYHQFMCILECHMDGSTGRLKAGSLSEINSQIDSDIGGLGAVILKSMTSLAGEGGMNNLASLGSSTGDCSDCGCTTCDISQWQVLTNGDELFRDEVSVTIRATLTGANYTIDFCSNNTGFDPSTHYTTNCCLWDYKCVVGGTGTPAVPTINHFVACGDAYSGGLSSISGQPVPKGYLIELQNGLNPFTVTFTIH